MNTLPIEERARLAAIVEMSLKFAGARDPELLLQSVCHVAREIIRSQYASVAFLHEDGQTISGRAYSGPGAEAVMPSIPMLWPDLLTNMFVERKALRLSGASTAGFGFNFPTGDSTILGVPLFGSSHVRGWLFLANKLNASEFSDEDEQMALVLAGQVSLAYARVAEQERADAVLSESKDIVDAMFESAPDAIVAVNEDGRIVRVNAQTQNLFGYRRDELAGELVEILVPERLRAAHRARRQQYSSCPRRRPAGEGLELLGRRKDASEFAVDIVLSPLETKRGKLILSVIRDATDRKQNEKRIQQLNQSLEEHVQELETANQDLESFSYSVSHDLRAPLRQVDGFARILRERMGPQLDPDSAHYLQRIQDAAAHMGSLLEGLLDLARLGRQGLRVRLIDLASVASKVIEELKADVPHRQIKWILDPLPILRCDEVLIKAVLFNLISNAVKFTGLRECAIIRVGHRVENGESVIFVADNGVGFNMKYADKLFGIFQRLHRSETFPGTGIGLATVQRIIKKHGGRIWAEAELNSCATFHFTIQAGEIEQAEESKQEIEVLQ